MDPTSYKDFTTSRGLKYHYYQSSPKDGKPTLLLLHGFPSTSYDWRHQVIFFREHGYGLIVPDFLGYGGSSKPTDPTAYVSSLLSKDLVELVDAENAERVVVIGHDWGAKYASKLAGYYPDRFIAYAFLAVGYSPPGPNLKVEDLFSNVTKAVGYDAFGYWKFFSEAGADKIIEEHVDSAMSLVFPKDAQLIQDHFAPTGAFKAWLLEDRVAEVADYVTKDELRHQTDLLIKGGIAATLSYYKVIVEGHDAKDDVGIPQANYKVKAPTFFAGALHDRIAVARLQEARTAPFTENLTSKNYDAGHWVQLEAKDALNQDFHEWIQSL